MMDGMLIPRRGFLLSLASSSTLLPALAAASESTGTSLDPNAPLFTAPDDPQAWPAFRRALHRWRELQRRERRYDDSLYRQPEFTWARNCYCCGFLMLYDQTVYDAKTGHYPVEALLRQAKTDFGGYDAVVLWHAYPRLGTDPRNQFDFYRDMPGGILGLRDLIRRFHLHHVRVFLDYNPWDTGTRRELKSDTETLTLLVQALEADGLFLDTLNQGLEEFRTQLDAARPGVVLESELALPLDRISDHHLSWAQWFADSAAPGILRNKWFERRHQHHLICRWNRDHSGEIHTAWMNGTGMLVWENVFGSWMEWSPRDRSILRSILPILRRYANLFCGENWTPLIPTLSPHVYASCWETPGLRLWTVINRSDQPYAGGVFQFAPSTHGRHEDLIRGQPADIQAGRGHLAQWNTTLGSRGVGCLVEGARESLGNDFDDFLHSQKLLDQRSTTELHPPRRITSRIGIRATRRSRRVPTGMVEIPGGCVTLRTTLRVRECGFYQSVPPAEHSLGSSYEIRFQHFDHRVHLEPYAMDATPVTNADFARFLASSGYRPSHPDNFLKHWGHGHPPDGQEDHPVVWVDLEDARAYAQWAGKRLPTDMEWQHAAQGREGWSYPWGETWLTGRCNDGSGGDRTTSVTAFPLGRSPFGVWDLCGNTWEWTESEHTDGRTRFSLLKGGCFYRAEGSNWYFEGGPQTNRHAAKFLLLWPGLDRCSTIGFRCVLDLRST